MKRLCETEKGSEENPVQDVSALRKRGLSTQFIQLKNASKCNPTCLAQILLKINAKMGGINYVIDESPQSQITRCNFMNQSNIKTV